MIKMTDAVQCQTLSYKHKYSVYMGSLFNWKYYLCAKRIKIPRYEETSNEVLKSVFQILSEKQLCFCSLNIITVAVLSGEHTSVWNTKNTYTVADHCQWKVFEMLSIIASSWKSEHKWRSTVYASITVFERSPRTPGLTKSPLLCLWFLCRSLLRPHLLSSDLLMMGSAVTGMSLGRGESTPEAPTAPRITGSRESGRLMWAQLT